MDWSVRLFCLALFLMGTLAFFFMFSRIANWAIKKYIRDLCRHLELIGLKASISVLKHHTYKDLWKHILFTEDDIEGTVKLEGSDIDEINFIYEWGDTPPGNLIHLYFLVRSVGPFNGDRPRKTEMKMKRNSFFGKKSVDVEWKGDINLAMKLNSDSTLRHKLLNAEYGFPYNYIEIFPELKSGYTRLRTKYFLPTVEQFDILETIAKIIKS